MNADFAFVDELVPGIRWDAKYATWDNFTGKPVDGYLANRIVGTRALCAALHRAHEEAAARGFGLLLWDGYRPQRAVDRFLRWSQRAGGRPDEAAALPQHRQGRHVRAGLRRHQVGPQPGQHRRPDALPPGDR